MEKTSKYDEMYDEIKERDIELDAKDGYIK